jgi:serine/threonine-protein kinase HipA
VCTNVLADEVGLEADALIDRIADLARRLPEAMEQAAADPAVEELGSALPGRLIDAVTARATKCRGALA